MSPGKPRVPYCEERPGAAHSRRDQLCVVGGDSWDLRRVVPDDRAAVLNATVEFAASKVGQALGPQRLSA